MTAASGAALHSKSLLKALQACSKVLCSSFLDLVNTDVVVGEAGEQVSAVLVPGEGDAAEGLGLGGALFVGLEGVLRDVLQEHLGGQIEDLDALFSADDEPVELLGEEHAVHGRVALSLSEELAFNEVPDHDGSVAGAGSEVSGVVNHVQSVDLSLVSREGVLEVHVHAVPDLDGFVPRGGHADRRLGGVVELDARDGVGVFVLVHGVLALGAGVPDLDLSVEAAGNDLAVIYGQSD